MSAVGDRPPIPPVRCTCFTETIGASRLTTVRRDCPFHGLPDASLSTPTAPKAAVPTDLTASAPDRAADVVGTTDGPA